MQVVDTYSKAYSWFETKGWTPFPFQEQAWEAYDQGKNGLINAPTGSGKTYSLFIPILAAFDKLGKKPSGGPFAIWITPIRALAKEIFIACNRAIAETGSEMVVGIRTGDTSASIRAKMKKTPPNLLITTPESLHILLASKNYPTTYKNLQCIVIDEWHELLGTKRGVQVELALSRLKALVTNLRIWGISATIGNIEQALEVLLGTSIDKRDHVLIRSKIKKQILVESILDQEVETLPWGGHLGIKLLESVIPVIDKSESALIFANTRSQCEIWYQRILDVAPHLAGQMAMHHSAISRELRDWVEENLHEGKLKAVVCTSSLDLGVDFRPVETIIQIGSPKGIARFIQRAGRSGHQPGATSTIYFVPTHALELMEVPALREAIEQSYLEQRIPHIRSFDVLVQYLMTLAVSDGFIPRQIFAEIIQTHCFQSITQDEFQWCLHYITKGGSSLGAYNEYQKVIVENGVYKIVDRRIAQRHRLSIGTIVGESSIRIKYLSGKYIGTMEEYFVSSLKPGDVFWFAGRSLEFVKIKNMEAYVRKSTKKNGRVPAWNGSKMALSGMLSEMLRLEISMRAEGIITCEETAYLDPLFELQMERSALPKSSELLIEYFETRDGYHLMVFPFEGRSVHEGMAALIASRISKSTPISCSIAMNDYGFELLSDKKINLSVEQVRKWFDKKDLILDIQSTLNAAEMAKRQFRQVARISGLIFQGYPNKPKKERHIQSSAGLLFDVFKQYEPNNLLYLQTFEEVLSFQLEEARLRSALDRIAEQDIIIHYPDKVTPFSFPLMVERLREKFTTEKLMDRIRKMQIQWKH